MSNFKFSQRSLSNLDGIDSRLVAICHRALSLSSIDFVVIEGYRTLKRQRELYECGASQTMNSKHLTGKAVDVAAYVNDIRWDWPLYEKIAIAFKEASRELNIPIIWGGDWKMRDGPHFELKFD